MGSLPDVGAGGVAGLIVAFTGLFTVIVGAYQSRAGAKTERRNEIASQEMRQDQQELEQRRYEDKVKDDLIVALNVQVDRERARADHERAQGEEWYAKWHAAEERADAYREQLHVAAQVIVSEATRSAAVDGVTDGDVPDAPRPV